MHLYTNSQSPNGRRVAVALKEKGIDIPVTEIDIRKGENLTDDYKAKNPAGRVPVLETDKGSYIAETVAITRYLESLEPEPNLFGKSGEQQAQIDMWNRFVEFNLLIPVAQAFRNLSGFFKDREKVCQEWGEISAEVAQQGAKLFETQLANNAYIAGDKFSVADISLMATLSFAKAVGQDLLTTPNLAAYYGRVKQRPSFS